LRGLEFLQLILPDEGLLVGFAKKDEQRRQQAFTSLEKLIGRLSRLDAAGWDVYHACASFREQKIWNAKLKKFEVRSHDNVLWLCCLFLDLDTRESHADAFYATREEAYLAVVAFCAVAGLPLPIFVSSGGGLHVYWPLAIRLSLVEWQSYALGLKRACKCHGLQADPARTADASSILRTPGTTHRKLGVEVEHGDLVGPYPIELFEHLKGIENDRNAPVGKTRVVGNASPIARAMSNVYGSDTGDPALVDGACRQCRGFVASPGRYQEPFHHAAVTLYGHCGPGGLDFYKDTVRGRHPDWSDAWADDKWSRSQVYGPTTCKRFEALNPGGCDGCPNKITEEITSPIILSRGYRFSKSENKVPSSTIQERIHAQGDRHSSQPGIYGPANAPHAEGHEAEIILPDPFKLENNQLIFPQEVKGGKYEPIIVSDFPIYLSGVHAGETDVHSQRYVFQHHLPHHGWSPIALDASALWNGLGLPRLASGGALIRDAKLFVRFAHDSVRDWNKANKMKILYEQCGWKDDYHSFLVGHRLYKSNGTVIEAIGNDELATRGQWLGPVPGGDVRKWVTTTSALIPPDHHAAIFAILCSFAAPLMAFHPKQEGGTILSLLSTMSAKGKTTILEICGSVWGLMRGLEIKSYDTGPSKGLVFATLANIPVIFDELATLAKKQHPELLAEFVNMFSQGTDKLRALQHGQGIRHTQGGWLTVLLTASNHSIIDQLGATSRLSDAPGMRVLELPAAWNKLFNVVEGEKLRNELFVHAGHAGEKFIQHLLQPEVMAFARRAIETWTRDIWRQLNFRPEHRFRVRLIAAAAVAGELLRQLGLLQFDLEATIRWVIEQLGGVQGRDDAREVSGRAALVDYLSVHTGNVLTVENSWIPGQARINPLPWQMPKGRLMIRYETKPERLLTPVAEFKRFAIEQGYPYAEMLDNLQVSGIVKNARKLATLSAGTTLPGGQALCLEIDMNHPAMSGVARLVENQNDETSSRSVARQPRDA